MKILLNTLAILLALLGALVVVVWVMVPYSTPWRAALQQLSALPDWLVPDTITRAEAEARIRAVDGYGVAVFATGIFDARVLRVTPRGDVLVSVPRAGQVLLLEADRNGDGASDGQRVLLDGLRRPYGLDLFGDYLYVGEADGIGRIRFDADTGTAVGAYERVVNGLPTGGNHWRNPIRFGPDNLLYVTIGLIVSLMLAFAVNDGLRNSVLDSLGL